MLEVMLAGVAADTPLFTWTPNQMRKLHDQFVRFLGIPTVDGIGITPGSHRGGGGNCTLRVNGEPGLRPLARPVVQPEPHG